MKNAVLAVLLMGLGATSAFAGEGISASRLSQMGLASMQVASDAEGSEVRGEGFRAWASGAAMSIAGTAVSGPLVYAFGSGERNSSTNSFASGGVFTQANFSIETSPGFTLLLQANALGSSSAFSP